MNWTFLQMFMFTCYDDTPPVDFSQITSYLYALNDKTNQYQQQHQQQQSTTQSKKEINSNLLVVPKTLVFSIVKVIK
jgi:hypothetical protein